MTAVSDRRAMALPASPVRRRIVLTGAVQGVGFRPAVWRLARRLGLAGWVRNTRGGLEIEIEGPATDVDAFVEEVRAAPPPHARIDGCSTETTAAAGERAFVVRESTAESAGTALVLPDLATCPDCLAEILDPSDRRYRHPFANCTACGPRLSILSSLPYDRAATSMAGFAMCDACRREFEDPADRRFHAQPIACPDCGPRLALRDADGAPLADGGAALDGAVARLRAGAIVAAQGIGGFHLLVDATDEAAVARLRARKLRPRKPFALMLADVAAAERLCVVPDAARTLIASAAAPIVLLDRRVPSAPAIAASVAPGLARLGAMLAATPLHRLLLHDLGRPLVATSGNRGDEPVAIAPDEAVARLAGIADAFLVHDRPILRPVEDSVVQLVDGAPQTIRRGRGLAPLPFALPAGAAPGLGATLATGGHGKSAGALAAGGRAWLGPPVGTLDSVVSEDAARAALADLARFAGAAPARAACDLHAGCAATRLAHETGLPVVPVQHHLAHVVSCLVDNGTAGPVLGIAWDGTGDGGDGTVWGGEAIEVDLGARPPTWRRRARLLPFRLPGGDAAVRAPARSALAALHVLYGDAAAGMTDLAPVAAMGPAERRIVARMIAGGVRSPWTTSAGRLFDAVAALLGLTAPVTYEGEAAVGLEAMAAGRPPPAPYPIALVETDPLTVDWRPMLAAIVADVRDGGPRAAVAARFHETLAAAVVAVAGACRHPVVALTGGCFQNRRLAERTCARLRAAGLTPLVHRAVPPGDGGVALGQAVWAHLAEAR